MTTSQTGHGRNAVKGGVGLLQGMMRLRAAEGRAQGPQHGRARAKSVRVDRGGYNRLHRLECIVSAAMAERSKAGDSSSLLQLKASVRTRLAASGRIPTTRETNFFCWSGIQDLQELASGHRRRRHRHRQNRVGRKC